MPRTAHLIVLTLLAGACLTAFAQDPLNIGARRELFVDHALIDTLDQTELRLQTPVERETVITFDAPWEGRYVGYVTLIQDAGTVRMYYRGLPDPKKDGSDAETTCYAESADGIHFEKPNLGLFEVHGTMENNVVLSNSAPFTHNFAPFLDTRPGVTPEERYKAIAGTSETGLMPFVSGDGLHWRRLREEPLITEGKFDSQNVAFWSEHEQQYLCYFRTWTETGYGGFRTVSRATSPDFLTWSAPVKMDFGGTPMEHLYTNQTLPYFRAPHIYVAIAARFMPGRTVVSEEEGRTLGIQADYWKDISDNVLLTSRGGNVYTREFMEGFVRPGIGLENWTSRTNYPAWGILQTGDKEMSFYVQHNYGQPTACLARYTLRPDGFIALHAPYAGGSMTSRPLIFSGGALYLNMSTSAAGFVKVELLDDAGAPIPGYTADEARELIGNELEKKVEWQGGTDLSALAGKTVRMRLHMKDADVFSFQFR